MSRGSIATRRIYPALLVEVGYLFTEFLLVLGILLLDFLHLWRKGAHRLCGVQLPQGKREGEQAHNDGDNNDGYSKAAEEYIRKQDEEIQQWLKEDEVPNFYRSKCH